ncbi:MAG: hypothetical protein ABFR89_08900 [Actinomycetota bacterium]
MDTHPNERPAEKDLETLEKELEEVDAAEAPDTAEEIARRLGDALDGVDPGEKGTTT